MINLIKEQRLRRPKLCEFIRFLIVGGVSTIIDMFVMGIFIFLLNKKSYNNNFIDVFFHNSNVCTSHVVTGTAIGFIVGLIFNYCFSLLYVYDYNSSKAKSKKGFLLFTILSCIGLLIQTIGMFILYSILGVNKWLSKIALILVVLCFNYITRKVFVFKSNDKDNDGEHNEKIIIEKMTKKEMIINVLFTISSMCLGLFMYNTNSFGASYEYVRYLKYFYFIFTGGIVGFYLFVINKKALKFIKFKFDLNTILSIIYTVTIYSTYFTYGFSKNKLILPISIISIYAIYCYSYILVNFTIKFVKNFIDEMTDFEKKLFKYISITLICYVTGMFCITRLFAYPGDMYDAFISFDTGKLILGNYQINQLYPENDFRHFCMSLFIMPFTILPSIVPAPLLRGFIITIIQALIISYTAIKLIHFLKIEDKKMVILFCAFYLMTSTVLLNVVTAEKFIFALFYIIATIDFSLKKTSLKWLFYIGACGVLTTNVFLLPVVLLSEKIKIKDLISELVVAAILFFAIMLLSGQLNLFVFFIKSWEELKHFSSLNSTMGIRGNFAQYLIFNYSLIFMPPLMYGSTVIQAAPNYIFCIFGIIVLIIAILGYILNFKDKFAKTAFYWQIFMVILLALVGWGSSLNEMFIYSALFAWSSLGLIFKFIDKIIKSNKAKHCILFGLIAIIIVFNGCNLYRLINFAIKYFPSV